MEEPFSKGPLSQSSSKNSVYHMVRSTHYLPLSYISWWNAPITPAHSQLFQWEDISVTHFCITWIQRVNKKNWVLCQKPIWKYFTLWYLFSFQAWSNIVYELIPNVKELEQNLKEFTNIIDADEVLLFERATFLVISHYRMRPHRDANRFEKVSNIIKQFKLSCR